MLKVSFHSVPLIRRAILNFQWLTLGIFSVSPPKFLSHQTFQSGSTFVLSVLTNSGMDGNCIDDIVLNVQFPQHPLRIKNINEGLHRIGISPSVPSHFNFISSFCLYESISFLVIVTDEPSIIMGLLLIQHHDPQISWHYKKVVM